MLFGRQPRPPDPVGQPAAVSDLTRTSRLVTCSGLLEDGGGGDVGVEGEALISVVAGRAAHRAWTIYLMLVPMASCSHNAVAATQRSASCSFWPRPCPVLTHQARSVAYESARYGPGHATSARPIW